MSHWQMVLIVGIAFLIIEMATPVLFFLNLALACFVTAIFAYFINDWNILIPIFVGFSAIFLLFLRPILIKSKNGNKKTGVEEKYIGKTAKVVEKITAESGVVSIYDERWNARLESGEDIPVGEQVTIVRNESLLLYVKRVE